MADALFGVESPSGRLPQTFPRRLGPAGWMPHDILPPDCFIRTCDFTFLHVCVLSIL